MVFLEHKRTLPALLLLAALLFLPGLGLVHLFDWDEINFTEMAREMIVSNDWMNLQMNFQSFYEKPPLFIWLQAISMKLVGIGEYGARLPNALMGVLTVYFLWVQGNKYENQSFAVWWILCYICSLLPHFYFKSALIDPTFNLLIFAGICFAYFSLNADENKLKNIVYAAICIGLATMTKGPVALLIYGLTALAYLLSQGKFRELKLNQLVVFLLGYLVVVSSWYLVHYAMYGPSFIGGFIERQLALLSSHDAGHKGFFGFHPLVLLLGCAPASLYLCYYPFKQKIKLIDRLMLILLMIIIVLFELVQTKIIHYSSLAYFPISFLAARSIQYHIQASKKKKFFLVLIVGLIWIFAALLLGFIGANPSILVSNIEIKDPFAVANLKAEVSWSFISKYFSLVPLGLLLLASFHKSIKTKLRVLLQLLAFIIFIQGFMYLSLANIEQHTQGAAIQFVEELDRGDAPLFVYGQKSYIHHFYGKQRPSEDFKNGLEQIKSGLISKAYFIVKSDKSSQLEKELSNLQKLSDNNGFSFYLYEG